MSNYFAFKAAAAAGVVGIFQQAQLSVAKSIYSNWFPALRRHCGV